jgi:hypothetical protein
MTTTATERTVALRSSKDGKICYNRFMLQMYCAKHSGRFHHQFIVKVGFLGLFQPCWCILLVSRIKNKVVL